MRGRSNGKLLCDSALSHYTRKRKGSGGVTKYWGGLAVPFSLIFLNETNLDRRTLRC